MKHASKVDRTFAYTSADETSKPGYLAARFAKIRRELREKAEAEKAKPRATVKPIRENAK